MEPPTADSESSATPPSAPTKQAADNESPSAASEAEPEPSPSETSATETEPAAEADADADMEAQEDAEEASGAEDASADAAAPTAEATDGDQASEDAPSLPAQFTPEEIAAELAKPDLKKPVSAYMHFTKAKREEVKASLGEEGNGVAQVAKKMGALWKALPAEDKVEFETLAAQQKAEYKEAKARREAILKAAGPGAPGGEGEDGASEDGLVALAQAKLESTTLPLARVKRVVKSAGQVKNISKEASLALCRATELFVAQLAQASSEKASMSKRKTAMPRDVAEAIFSTPTLEAVLGADFERPEPQAKAAAARPRKQKKGAAAPAKAKGSASIRSFFKQAE